jgi:hypothetical protein
MDAEIVIHKASVEQLDQALGYVRSIYQKEFGTFPEHLPADCLVARDGQDIVGVMAMEFSEGARFEIENHFLLDFSILVHPRREFVSFGRWVAARPGTGLALMFAAVKYAIGQGRTRSLSCSKHNVLNFLRRKYGLRFDTIGVAVIPSSIALEDRRYFLYPPFPCLCTAPLQQWYDSLEPAVLSHIKVEL